MKGRQTRPSTYKNKETEIILKGNSWHTIWFYQALFGKLQFKVIHFFSIEKKNSFRKYSIEAT